MAASKESIGAVPAADADTLPLSLHQEPESTTANTAKNDAATEAVEDEATNTSGLEKAGFGIEKILCSSLDGNFYEQAALNSHRPEQLHAFFAIREGINEVVSENKNLKARIAQLEKAGSVSHRKLIEMMTATVDQKTAHQFRDSTIRCERLEEELKDIKTRYAKLEQKVKDRDGKENGKFKRHEEWIASLNQTVKKANEERAKDIQDTNQAFGELECADEKKALAIHELQETNAMLEDRLATLESEFDALAIEHYQNAAQM